MHGLTGGGWKRKRYRPWLKRKLPAGKPRQERSDLQPNHSPPRQPPTLLVRDHWPNGSVSVRRMVAPRQGPRHVQRWRDAIVKIAKKKWLTSSRCGMSCPLSEDRLTPRGK